MLGKFGRLVNVTAIVMGLGAAVLAPVALAVKQTGGEYNTLYAGLGAKGFNVVAYFTDGKAVPDSDRYTSDFGGVKWQFANRQHRDLFAADPLKYAPQYGGFCSWGVAEGKLFDVDPQNGWTIAGGKLYLNFNADINATFAKDAQGFVNMANRNWPMLNQ